MSITYNLPLREKLVNSIGCTPRTSRIHGIHPIRLKYFRKEVFETLKEVKAMYPVKCYDIV